MYPVFLHYAIKIASSGMFQAQYGRDFCLLRSLYYASLWISPFYVGLRSHIPIISYGLLILYLSNFVVGGIYSCVIHCMDCRESISHALKPLPMGSSQVPMGLFFEQYKSWMHFCPFSFVVI